MDNTKQKILKYANLPQELVDDIEGQHDEYAKLGIKPVVKRRLIKTATWRVISTGITTAGVFLVTGSAAFAGAVGVIDAAVKTTAYYLHEHFWDKSNWYS